MTTQNGAMTRSIGIAQAAGPMRVAKAHVKKNVVIDSEWVKKDSGEPVVIRVHSPPTVMKAHRQASGQFRTTATHTSRASGALRNSDASSGPTSNAKGTKRIRPRRSRGKNDHETTSAT